MYKTSSIKSLAEIITAVDTTTMITIIDKTGLITYANEMFYEKSKYDQYELIGESQRKVIANHHTDEFFKDLWNTIRRGEVWKGEIKNIAKDGTYFWVYATIVPFLNEAGEPHQYVSIQTDITNRKQTEETVKKMLEQLTFSDNNTLLDINQLLMESSIMVISDTVGKITYVSDMFCKISRFSREDLLGSDFRVFNSNYHSKEFFKDLWTTISQGNVWKGDIKNKAKDGSCYWVSTTIVPILDDSGKPYQFVSIWHDITERKKAEDLLFRSEKLTAIGDLSAGIAHEIRNPLTTIKGFIQFLSRYEDDLKKMEYFQLINEEIDRINFMVGEFMVLSKPHVMERKPTALLPIINKVAKLLESELTSNRVRLSIKCEASNIKINCEENLMKQVFLNLVKNSIEAMPQGGIISISVSVTDTEVFIHFKDEGIGIPEENLMKLRVPFFTTKENGNGLGLMVSYKIIENHNGKIQVESEENVGTTITLILPAIC